MRTYDQQYIYIGRVPGLNCVSLNGEKKNMRLQVTNVPHKYLKEKVRQPEPPDLS